MNLLQKLFGTGTTKAVKEAELPVENSLKTDYNKTRQVSAQRSGCFAPSVNMIFSEDGTIKVCCHNRENLLGNYPEKSIHELWHGEDAVLFRQKMKEFSFLSGCWVCTNDYNRGSFAEMPSRHFDSLPQHHTYPTMMEFLLKNTCNLECVMCSGELSSSIRTNREKLPLQKSPYGPEFLEQIQEFIPYLKETRFSSSGEAFLIDTNFKLWEMLIERNPECLIVVQTNGTIMNGRVKDYLNRGNFKIGVSLDSLQKEVFEAIRVNASFERVMENIQFFAQYSKERNKPLNISTCVMRQNWSELPDFVNFCNRIEAVATFHKVMTPLPYALHNLPAEELQHIYDELSNHQFTANTRLEKLNKAQYEYFLSVIASRIENAGKRNEEPEDLRHLNTTELNAKFKSSLRTYILQGDMLEKDREGLYKQCESKIDYIIQNLEKDQQKKEWLLLMNSIPVPSIFPAIKNLSTEKLYELSVLRVEQY